MKFNHEELLELTTADGGRFCAQTLEEAQRFCKKIATSHYENFPVGSLLIPKVFREHFFSVYAFSRIADDLADELITIGEDIQLSALNEFEKRLLDTTDRQSGNPIFLALRHTMMSRNIPPEPFQRLLTAFRRDVHFQRPVTMQDNLDYCHYSANPVGELVLRIFGLWNSTTSPLSDAICTGLQLANFWQDISRDFEKGRIYIPTNILPDFPLENKDNLVGDRNYTNFTRVLKNIFSQTEDFFENGSGLVQHLPYFRLRLEIALTIEGGRAILRKTNRLGGAILIQRPAIRYQDIFWILLQTVLRHKIFSYRS